MLRARCANSRMRSTHAQPDQAGLLSQNSFFFGMMSCTGLKNQDGSPRPDYDNVRDSGELFRQYTLLNKSDADAVYYLIMATANHLQARAEQQYYVGFTGDLDLFLDLDLSSLASPWQEFVENFARIRAEFSWAPEVVFCSSQIQILENFAEENVRLYRRAETSEKWRDAARANLKRCVTDLRNRIAELSSV